MGKPVEAVVLDRQWTVSTLIGETFRLYWRHRTLFVPLALIIVVPALLLVHLVWGEDAADWGFAPGSVAGVVIPVLLTWLVVPALGLAAHVVALLAIADGERPSLLEALRAGLQRLVPAMGAVALQLLAMIVGFAALIVPGVYLSVALWLAPQAAVAEGRDPVGALRRSHELVKGRWWQTFGRLLLGAVVLVVAAMPLTIMYAFDYGVVYVVGDILFQTVALSFYSIFSMLLFAEYRGAGRPAEPAPAPAYGGFEPPQAPGAGQ
jgi:hypothetical protein